MQWRGIEEWSRSEGDKSVHHCFYGYGTYLSQESGDKMYCGLVTYDSDFINTPDISKICQDCLFAMTDTSEGLTEVLKLLISQMIINAPQQLSICEDCNDEPYCKNNKRCKYRSPL